MGGMMKAKKNKQTKDDERNTHRSSCGRVVAIIAGHSIVANLRLFRRYYRMRRRPAQPIELVLEEIQSGKTKVQ